MRILCLNFQKPQEPSCAEMFLTFSPRVQFRYSQWVFIDVESTARMFGGEDKLLSLALERAHKIDPDARAAIGNTTYSAQAFAEVQSGFISSPDKEREQLGRLPLRTLLVLEGLKAWSKPSQIEHIIQFFSSVGIHSIDETFKFQASSFRERWGDIGALLHRRLHNLDSQVISPLISQEPLVNYGYFDDPVSHIPLLMNRVEPCLQQLFLRLEGLNRFCAKLQIVFHCEYSTQRHSILIEPVCPNRDIGLYVDLLVERVEKLDFTNPVREFEIFLYDVPEKIQQLDFFEPRDLQQDRWRRLISFAQQNDVEMGFLQVEKSPWPEQSYSFKTDIPIESIAKDEIVFLEGGIQVKSVYAKALQNSPRPSLLLKEPLQLSASERQKLKFISRFPIERIEGSWWRDKKERDYYFALTEENQLLWVYKDRLKDEFFVQGYFD